MTYSDTALITFLIMSKSLIILFAAFAGTAAVCAQEPAEPDTELAVMSEERIFSVTEQPARFAVPDTTPQQWLVMNLSKVPGVNFEKDDVLRLRFVVEKDGSVSHAEIMQGINQDIDDAVLHLLECMPAWIPAKNQGREVRSYVNLTLNLNNTPIK